MAFYKKRTVGEEGESLRFKRLFCLVKYLEVTKTLIVQSNNDGDNNPQVATAVELPHFLVVRSKYCQWYSSERKLHT
ncbi:hypothetical protein PsAD14_03602 [Pseudovibrio sp. Ad14]|nr:hypothetical protein PsW74_04600 [Pseudovibrio sp. W74]KZL07220.1 hypothetical protein PsAD14_03602 [Pseudovibrio sp. Ad14]